MLQRIEPQVERAKVRRFRPRRWIAGFLVLLALSFAGFAWSSLGQLRQLPLFSSIGFPGAARYLVVFQNDAERRPTGGFITKYALLSFHFGLPWLSFGDVYDPALIQKGTRPADPFAARLLASPTYPGHGFRDGNLDPDFPASARELIRLYQLGYPDTELDGVLSLDFTAFTRIFVASGQATGEFAPDLLFARVEHEIQNIDFHDPAEVAARKNIIGALAGRILKSAALHPGRWDELAGALAASFNEKHAQLYFVDPELQARVERIGWAGQLPRVAGVDIVGIIESNLGGLKSSRYLLRDIEYRVDFTRDAAGKLAGIGNLKVRIEHRGDYSEPVSGYYKGVWDALAPAGAQLDRGMSSPVSAVDSAGSWQRIRRELDLQPGESRELEYRYSLPASILSESGEYRLQLFRQPGGLADPVRISIQVPTGLLISSADFVPLERLAVWQGVLDRDQLLSLQILPDREPPRVSSQQFAGGIDAIDIRFAEPLDPASVPAAQFSIADKNFRNSVTDPVVIRAVEFRAPQTVRLRLAGVSEVCREQFAVTISGIRDPAGNAIQNKEITAVQWLNSAGQNCDPENKL